MIIGVIILVTGLAAIMVASERFGLRFGGVVVVPLLAMYTLFDYTVLPMFAISTAIAYLTLVVVQRRYLLYGRSTFLVAITAGALVPTLAVLVPELLLNQPVALQEVAYLGSILPGLAAYNVYRLADDKRIADIVGSLALLLGLLVLTGFFFVARSLLLESASLQTLIDTTIRLVSETGSSIITAPPPILPRWYIVGLFVAGLLVKEIVHRRYSLRLSGVIAIPLIAVFTLGDVDLFWLYLLVTFLCAIFIRVTHRSTFVYGRNLLTGTCMFGVVLGSLSIPILPGDTALRALFVGVLAGVTSYNFHVLAPSERVESIVLSTSTFCSLYLLAYAGAVVLGKPTDGSLEVPMLLVCLVLILVGIWTLLEQEALRPDDSIEMLSHEVTMVPDGGEVQRNRVRVDGGTSNPLAGRRIGRLGPNAEVVYWEASR